MNHIWRKVTVLNLRLSRKSKLHCEANKLRKLREWNKSAEGAKTEFNKLFIVDNTKRFQKVLFTRHCLL